MPNDIEARINVDTHIFWENDDLSPHDELGRMINAFSTYLVSIAEDPHRSEERQTSLHIIAMHNVHALLWRQLLVCGAAHPFTFGRTIRSLLLAVPVLECSITTIAAGKLLSALYSALSVSECGQIEQTICSLSKVMPEGNHKWGEHIRDRLLGCLDVNALVTEEAKDRVEQLGYEGGAPPNEDPVQPIAAWRSEATKSNEPYQHLRQLIKAFTALHGKNPPSIQEAEAIFLTLRSLREILSTPNGDNVDEYQHFTAWVEIVEACECITRCEQLSCITELGNFVSSVLLEAAVHPEPIYRPEHDVDFDNSPAWGGNTPRINAAAGLTTIAQYEDCILPSILEAVERLCFDEVPAVRLQVAGRLFNLYRTAPDMMWRLLDRLSHDEPSRSVLESFVVFTLQPLARNHADQAADLVKSIYIRTSLGAGASRVRQACINLFTQLYMYQNHALSREIVLATIDRPYGLYNENWHITAVARGALKLGPVKAPNQQLDRVRQRAWSVMERVPGAVWAALQQIQRDQAKTNEREEDRQERICDLYRLVDSVGSDLYFASGASDEIYKQNRSIENDRRFYIEAEPVLNALRTFKLPSLVHYLLQTLEFLIPVNPTQVFLRIGRLVLDAKEGGYQYELSAIGLIVRVVERYLAEYRQVLREDEQCLQILIRVLDTFVEVGWPPAWQLTYRIEEIFQ